MELDIIIKFASAFGAGALGVKILEAWFSKDKRALEMLTAERDLLHKDVGYLRGEIEALRGEVFSLKKALEECAALASAAKEAVFG